MFIRQLFIIFLNFFSITFLELLFSRPELLFSPPVPRVPRQCDAGGDRDLLWRTPGLPGRGGVPDAAGTPGAAQPETGVGAVPPGGEWLYLKKNSLFFFSF